MKENVLKVSIILTYTASKNSYFFINNNNRCNKTVTCMEAVED